MLKAIVLSGGGSKGAYQIGAWKALKKIGYHYDIVTGTSIGSVNGMLMVQNDYKKAIKFWNNITFSDIFEYDIENHQVKEVYKTYAKNFVKNGGMDTSKFAMSVAKLYNEKKFNKSKINYGIMTYNLTKKKHEAKLKAELKDNIVDYILASCTCYPIFEITKIEGEKYLDGAFYDNVPINLAIKMGAKEIVAIDVKAFGLRKKVKNKDVNIKYIYPRNDLGPPMYFDKKIAQKSLDYGYNDVMKEMCKLDGTIYTFKKSNLIENYSRINVKYVNILDEIFKNAHIKRKTSEKLLKSDLNNEINITLEYLGKLFELDDSKIYNIKNYNKELKTEFKEVNNSTKSLKEIVNKKVVVKYIYEKIINNNYKNSEIKLYIKLFPSELLSAIYLMVI